MATATTVSWLPIHDTSCPQNKSRNWRDRLSGLTSTIADVRRRGATASLERILGDKPDGLDRATELLKRAGEAGTVAGHPLYAGLVSLDWPGDPMGNLWRAADIVREHRGDSHTAAW